MAVTVPARATTFRSLGTVVPAASDRLGLLAFVRDRLESPLRILDPDAELQPMLDERWRTWCRDFEVDSEIPLVEEHGYLEETLEFWYVQLEFWDDLRPDAVNIQSWYATAAAGFAEQVANFAAPFSLPSERPKHYPPASARTEQDLRRSSRSGESVLAFGLGPNELGMLARSVESQFFDELWGGAKYRGAVDCLTTVGFVEGEPTHYLAVEWTPQAVHAYPVSEREAVAWSGPRAEEQPEAAGRRSGPRVGSGTTTPCKGSPG